MLVLIATPIGNLADISERARSELSSSDVVLCEDTRRTGLLFQALSLSTPPLMSLHRFNEASRADEIIQLLKQGKKIALVSDAGTPAISDPGAALVARCHQEGLAVSAVPGPCAFATAYALSGASTLKMQFLGFLPKRDGDKRSVMRGMLEYDGASLVYESPQRVLESIAVAAQLEPLWEIVLVRELTKIYESVIRATAKDLCERLKSSAGLRGECTLVFLKAATRGAISEEALVEQVASVRGRFSCSLKEAVELVAKAVGVPCRSLYQACIHRE